MLQVAAFKLVCFTIHIMLMVWSTYTIAVTENQFSVHGLSAFKSEKSIMLESWLTTGVNATRATLGIYPTPLSLHIFAKKSNQPVPWAHTVRDGRGTIHFYVDTRFPLNKFINDWTIYHELAHMALPYLGSEYRWFSEGFASFMQYQIMADMGILEGSLTSSYEKKIAPHLRWFNSNLPAAEVAKRRLEKRDYPAGYWGGAYFFVLAEQQLKTKKNMSLASLIAIYQDCCRAADNNINELVKSLDNLIGEPLFATLLKQYETAPAKILYPEYFE